MDAENIIKGKPLTKEEMKVLVCFIENSSIIISKTTNATNNKLKNEEWIRITELFNAVTSSQPRTPQQLRLKWENLKKNARKRMKRIHMNQIEIGSGPPEHIPQDEILDRVTGLLDSTASGFTVEFGGDREQVVEFDGECGDRDSDGDDGDPIGDVKVAIHKAMVMVPDHCVTDSNQNPMTPNTTKRLTFRTPRAGNGKKKLKANETSRTARNVAIAEYYSAKKQCLDSRIDTINLENENLKLINLQLKLKNEKLLLETEKVKLEIKKLKENLI